MKPKIFLKHISNKSIFYFLLFAILFPSFSIGQQQNKLTSAKNDLQKLNLRGKVKSVKETLYSAVFSSGVIQKGDIINPDELMTYYTVLHVPAERGIEYGGIGCLRDKLMEQNSYITFNEKGKLIDHTLYLPDNTILIHCSYKYDDKNNLISSKFDFYERNRVYETIYTYKYDIKNNLIELNSELEPGKYFKISYKNDGNGNMVEKKGELPDANSNYNYIWSFKYDNKNNIIEATGKEKNTYKYDDGGNMNEELIQYKRGKVVNTIKCNEMGDVLNAKTLVWKVENSIERLEAEINMTFKYEYDKNKNWLKKIVYKDDKPQKVIEREIVYY